MFAAVGGSAMWYLTRSSGVVSLIVLTSSVVLGLLSSGRWESRRWPRFVVQGLHRNVSLVVLVFLGLHIATTVLDGFVPIGWKDAVVPFVSAYRPIWIGLGALAVDCLLAIIVTSLVRLRLGQRAWRSVHMLAYACWPIALVHGLGAGTDTRQRWMLAIDALCVLAVLASLWWRLIARRPLDKRAAPIAFAASLLVPILIGLFAWVGPTKPGWASHGGRFGAPAIAATGAATTVAPDPTAIAPSTPPPTLPDDADIAGTRTVTDADGTRTITLATRSTDGALTANIDLVGVADPSGGVVLSGGNVTVGLAGTTATWKGAVVSLHGDTLRATLTGPDGAPLSLTARLAVDRSTGTLTGSLHFATSGSDNDS